MIAKWDGYPDEWDDQKETANEMTTAGCMIFIGAFFVVLAVAVICYLITK